MKRSCGQTPRPPWRPSRSTGCSSSSPSPRTSSERRAIEFLGGLRVARHQFIPVEACVWYHVALPAWFAHAKVHDPEKWNPVRDQIMRRARRRAKDRSSSDLLRCGPASAIGRQRQPVHQPQPADHEAHREARDRRDGIRNTDADATDERHRAGERGRSRRFPCAAGTGLATHDVADDAAEACGDHRHHDRDERAGAPAPCRRRPRRRTRAPPRRATSASR